MILKNFEIHQRKYKSFIKVLRPSKKKNIHLKKLYH